MIQLNLTKRLKIICRHTVFNLFVWGLMEGKILGRFTERNFDEVCKKILNNESLLSFLITVTSAIILIFCHV